MTTESIIQKTISTLSKLSRNNAHKVADFADFLLAKKEHDEIRKLTYRNVDESEAFNFLHEEEDIYNLSDATKVFK